MRPISEQVNVHRVGHTVERQLDTTLWLLLNGDLGLQDLTPALAGFYSIGFADGQDSLRARLQTETDTADRLYERLHHGKDLPDVQLRRMRAAAAEYWEEVVGPLIAAQHAQRGNS